MKIDATPEEFLQLIEAHSPGVLGRAKAPVVEQQVAAAIQALNTPTVNLNKGVGIA